VRGEIREVVERLAGCLPVRDPVVEIGSNWSSQGNFADLRPCFPGRPYIGVDMRGGPGVDLVATLPVLPMAAGSVGTVVMVDTLEHVEFLRDSIEEIRRVLSDDGFLILTSVFAFPIHSYPDDFWRFTGSAFKSLLWKFSSAIVKEVGNAVAPHTVIGVASKNGGMPAEIDGVLSRWKAEWEKGGT